jgi:hypothetical protein
MFVSDIRTVSACRHWEGIKPPELGYNAGRRAAQDEGVTERREEKHGSRQNRGRRRRDTRRRGSKRREKDERLDEGARKHKRRIKVKKKYKTERN